MCRRVTCPKCHKPSFAGCGMHIDQVLGDVPKDDRCRCAEVAAPAIDPSSARRAPFWPW